MSELTDPRHIRFIDWLTTAPRLREPSTMEELAGEMKVAARTLRSWKHRPEVRAQWEKAAVQVAGDPERTQRILDALYSAATDPDARDRVQAAKAWAEMTGAIAPPAKAQRVSSPEELRGISDEVLDELIAQAAVEMKAERGAV